MLRRISKTILDSTLHPFFPHIYIVKIIAISKSLFFLGHPVVNIFEIQTKWTEFRPNSDHYWANGLNSDRLRKIRPEWQQWWWFCWNLLVGWIAGLNGNITNWYFNYSWVWVRAELVNFTNAWIFIKHWDDKILMLKKLNPPSQRFPNDCIACPFMSSIDRWKE